MTNSTWYNFIVVLNSGFEIYFLFFLGNFNRHDLVVDFNFFNHLDLLHRLVAPPGREHTVIHTLLVERCM